MHSKRLEAPMGAPGMGSSDDIALAVAIIMQGNNSGADAAARDLRDLAIGRGLSLEHAAAVVVAAGGDGPTPTGLRVRPRGAGGPDPARTARRAVEVLMRENALDAMGVAALMTMQALRHNVGIVELAQAIVDAADDPRIQAPQAPPASPAGDVSDRSTDDPVPPAQRAVMATNLRDWTDRPY